MLDGNKAYTEAVSDVYPECIQDVSNAEPQVRLGKDRVGQGSTGEDIEEAAPPKPVRHKYGMYGLVLLTDEDYEKLKEEFPHDYSERIARLDEYIASTGKKYKNHLATIRSWARKDGQKKQESGSRGGNVFLDIAKEEGIV